VTCFLFSSFYSAFLFLPTKSGNGNDYIAIVGRETSVRRLILLSVSHLITQSVSTHFMSFPFFSLDTLICIRLPFIIFDCFLCSFNNSNNNNDNNNKYHWLTSPVHNFHYYFPTPVFFFFILFWFVAELVYFNDIYFDVMFFRIRR